MTQLAREREDAMNREQAEKAAREIMIRVVMGEERNLQLREHIVADIIERACGQDVCGVKFTGATGKNVYTCVLPRDHVGEHDDAAMRGQIQVTERSCGETAWVSRDEDLAEVRSKDLDSLRDALDRKEPAIDDARRLLFYARRKRALPSPPTGRAQEGE